MSRNAVTIAFLVIVPMIAAPIAGSLATAGDPVIDFETDVAPILAEHCVRCHSPGNRQGEVSLATFEDLELLGYVTAGEPDASYLIDLVRGSPGEPPEMPAEGPPLSKENVAKLEAWVTAGADWPDGTQVRQRSKADATWWSFQPLADVQPPAVTLSNATPGVADELPPGSELPPGWDVNPIDAFVAARLAEQGLTSNPPADRRELIRRATYDLTGLPPTPEQVDAFRNDPHPRAYERLIDRLLQSPRYGERWGRHWLDVVRFGESNGFERNVVINTLWPFRDYVIRSINEDKPFDRFIREHLAGDVPPHVDEHGKHERSGSAGVDPDVAVGTAFLVAGPYDDVGNQDPVQAAQIRANTIDEMIGAASQAFLGLTVGCARCHDHKFDPITQQDYYGLYATFAGVRHGAVKLETPEEKAAREARLEPLNRRKSEAEKARNELDRRVLARAKERIDEFESRWIRPPVDRTGTEETFPPVTAKFVRLICEARDTTPAAAAGFRIDEFEIWSAEPEPANVALASGGAVARGRSRQIEDFPGAYGPQLTIDGKFGARFIAAGNDLTIELPEPTRIERVFFSSARGEETSGQSKFVFVGEYRIQASEDGKTWTEIAHGRDRRPVTEAQRDRRMLAAERTEDERAERQRLTEQITQVAREIAKIPSPPNVWIGTRHSSDAEGPFHVYLGGDPQKPGEQVNASGLSALDSHGDQLRYELPADVPEARRRQQLADWITHPDNPLTPRVLANRLWHYHFGTGIVDTPSDLGYMGGRPTHPKLLDYLATRLQSYGWRLKPMHRLIMTSQAYRQSSRHRPDAARIDGDARYLWRFPPRRLTAEEIRDTVLSISGVLNLSMGGPGFRLYRFMQDNVCTYEPLDRHGPGTYRRAVYHQNVRASVVDLMTDFDQPDCAFAAPRRAETTTPLQALTMLNHDFTLAMAETMAARITEEVGDESATQVRRAFRLAYAREPDPDETDACVDLVRRHGLAALCRTLFNTSELIHLTP